MAYSANTPVTKPLVLVEVAKLLGTNIKDIGRLCTSNKINMWSKYKPYKGALKFDDDNQGLKGSNYGIQVKSNTDGTMEWSYVKPDGGVNSPYRLGDFWKYYHSAKPQYYVQICGPCSHSNVNIEGQYVFNMDIKKTLSSSENKFEITLINRQLENGYLKDYCIQNSDIQYLNNYSTFFFALKVGTSGNAWSAFTLSNQSGTGIYSGTGAIGNVNSDNAVTLLVQVGVSSASLVGTAMPYTWLPPACIKPYIAINATPRGVFYNADKVYDEGTKTGLYVTSKGSTITDNNGTVWNEYLITAFKFGGKIIPVNEYDQDYSYVLSLVLGNNSQSTNVGIILESQLSQSGSETIEQQKKRLLSGTSIFGTRSLGTKNGSHTSGSGEYNFNMVEELTTSNGILLYAKQTITSGNRNMSIVPQVSAQQSNTEIDNVSFYSKTFDVSSLQYYWNYF